MKFKLMKLALAILLLQGCTSNYYLDVLKSEKRKNRAYNESRGTSKRHIQIGMASWYGNQFHGRKTASGEIFNQYAYTAAHRTLPFGTKVLVTNLDNSRQIVVRINDRGPFNKKIIDLSRQSAAKIGMLKSGIARVKIEVIS